MPRCTACGQDNIDIARFCLACGAALETTPGGRHEERRIISVLFVDLVGFTSRAERLDPEDVQALLRPYHDAVRADIESFGGYVEKFIGDAVVGVFGAPTAYGDDAERAVRAALSVRATIATLNASDANLALNVRIAVNTGEALVRLDARRALGESLVVGDVVNTASRLQTAAPVDGILVGEETYRTTRAAIAFEAADAVDAKGKEAPVPAWLALHAIVGAGERPATGEVVGRDRELRGLSEIWTQVIDDREPHLVTVIGPTGVGKTRLGTEFARAVEGRSGLAVRGRSLPYRESTAYGALGFQLKQLCGIFESDPVDVGLQKLALRVGSLVEPSQADAVCEHLAILLGFEGESTATDRESFFFSIRSFIEAAAREQPMLLVFEDLHWGDESLLDLVELLAARLRDVPVLMLALARPELLDARPGWGGGLLAHTAFPLRPLRAEDALALATQRLGSVTADELEERAAYLAALAEGNPLFIEQLAATLAETRAEDARVLPTTIREIIAARLDGLPEAERSVVLDAAVVGKVFWRGALERVRSDGEALSELLAALERRDLLRRETVSAIEGDHQYSFTHVLVRDVAYELLPRARRQELHREAALFFEAATAEVGEAGAALARHWRDAGDPARAVEYFTSAAETAEHGWAKERAVELYREALQLVPESDGERRATLRRRLAVAHQASYHVTDARLLGRGKAVTEEELS